MSEYITPWKPLEVSVGAWFVVRHVRENAGWEREHAKGLTGDAWAMFNNEADAQLCADGLNALTPSDSSK
jgi:hypothetical protein